MFCTQTTDGRTAQICRWPHLGVSCRYWTIWRVEWNPDGLHHSKVMMLSNEPTARRSGICPPGGAPILIPERWPIVLKAAERSGRINRTICSLSFWGYSPGNQGSFSTGLKADWNVSRQSVSSNKPWNCKPKKCVVLFHIYSGVRRSRLNGSGTTGQMSSMCGSRSSEN